LPHVGLPAQATRGEVIPVSFKSIQFTFFGFFSSFSSVQFDVPWLEMLEFPTFPVETQQPRIASLARCAAIR
jgi:hypothetical protein